MLLYKMPYKKSYKSRKYGRRSNVPWYKKKYSPIDLASKAMSGVNALRKLINVERKFADYTVQGVLNPTSSNHVTAVSQGVDYNEREGLSIKLNSLYLRGTLALQGSAPAPTNVRMLIVCDSDNTGIIPTLADVLETVSVNSPIQHTNGKRFQILKDRVYSLSPNGNETQHIKAYLKLQNHARYSDPTTGIREGHIFVFFVSDVYNSGTKEVYFTLYNRIRYIDN